MITPWPSPMSIIELVNVGFDCHASFRLKKSLTSTYINGHNIFCEAVGIPTVIVSRNYGSSKKLPTGNFILSWKP